MTYPPEFKVSLEAFVRLTEERNAGLARIQELEADQMARQEVSVEVYKRRSAELERRIQELEAALRDARALVYEAQEHHVTHIECEGPSHGQDCTCGLTNWYARARAVLGSPAPQPADDAVAEAEAHWMAAPQEPCRSDPDGICEVDDHFTDLGHHIPQPAPQEPPT